MTTSGVSSFNPAVVQIITQVLRDMVVIDELETPTAAMYAEGIFKLNSIVKGLETQNIHVWTEEEAILFLEPNQARYTLGSSDLTANAHCALADRWNLLQLAQGAAQYSRFLFVEANPTLAPIPYLANDDGTPILTDAGLLIYLETPGQIIGSDVGDNIGVVLENGWVYWTTISAVDFDIATGLYQITLATGIPLAASAGSDLFSYPVAAQVTRPLDVPRFRLLTYASPGGSPNEIPMWRLSRQEYMDLPNKLSTGVPTQAFYTPQRDLGYIYLWPVAGLPNWGIRFTWYRAIQDLLAPNNTMDFPQEWALPLQWMLANEWRLAFSVPQARSEMIKEQAALWYEAVAGWDRETQDIRFGMDYQIGTG